MQKSNKFFFLLGILLISVFVVIPNLLISIQRNSEINIDEKNPNEIINTRTPQKSSLYYGDTTGWALSVHVSGNYAFVADYTEGLAVIDISDPTNPGTPVYQNTTGSAYGVSVNGNYAYVADGLSGLAVIDISDPTNPGAPVYKNTNGGAYDVYVSGDYAYVADAVYLTVINITDPTNPGSLVYESITGTVTGIQLNGDYAYLAAGVSGLAVINISDPTNPGTPTYENTNGTALGVFISGDYAYVADGDSGLAIIDISDPSNPGIPVYENTTGGAYGVYVDGDYAYIADHSEGLAVINISDPTNPGTPVYENTTGYALDVHVSGDYAYVADWNSGLAVIKISEPIDPGTPIYEDTTGEAFGVYLSGNYAYITDRSSGLAIFDISDPTNPGTPVYEDTTGEAWGVYVSGDYAYVADWNSGLAVIDITDPTNPKTPVYEDTSYGAWDVYVSGDYAYVTCETSGLAVIDISDPTNPGTPVYADTTGAAHGVFVSGDYAYVADHSSGLAVIDISDPINPGTPIYADTNDYSYDIFVSGDYAYVADRSSGLAVIDISDPTNPGTPIYADTTGYAYSVYVSGDYAYVADRSSGLAVINISDPTNPGTPIYADTTGYAYGIYVSGDYAYVAATGSGLAVIQIRKRVDMEVPIISNAPSDFTMEEEYTGQSLSWTATDANPDTYTIELQGTGIVAGPTAWTSGNTIHYNIPDGFSIGSYIYTVTFTDDYHNSITDNVTFTVEDTTNPIIISSPINFAVEYGYTGQNLSWSATDSYPDTYTIELQGSGIVTGPTPWTSGVTITYNIPDGFAGSVYVYMVTFTDDSGNSITDSVMFTVEDKINPIITASPNNFTVEAEYVGQSLSWTATDTNPDTYTIELQGSGIVAGPTAWTSGVTITYNIPDGFNVGSYIYMIIFTDDSGNSITDSVMFTVEDTINPIITASPNNFTVEAEYMGQSLSWTATDTNPDTYTIELQGSGIVAGPTAWTSGVTITYNISDGFSVGSYIYTVIFTDLGGNFITDSVNFTVKDTTNPVITFNLNNFTVETGYTGQSLSWTATDANPDIYTIELQGSGIVTGPTPWTSGVTITYNIPDGFAVGIYIYTVNFTDDYGNSITDSITFIVEDTTNPIIISASSDLTVEAGYSGQSLLWTATDANPDTYTIELQGSGIIAGPTAWTSGVTITYNILDGLSVGSYFYTVNFTDKSGNFIINSVIFTVGERTNPVLDISPNDFWVERGYTGESLTWRAYDANPDTYAIELQGTGVVSGPTIWSSGFAIYYDIPDGFAVGVYVYTVNFTDESGNSIIDSVTFSVIDATIPTILSDPSDLTVEFGYTGQSLSWTATDVNPDTYTIEFQGSGIVVGPTAWTSGVEITYIIPNGFAPGVYTYNITFTDEGGNSISNSVMVTINSIVDNNETPEGAIPFGNTFLVFIGFSVIYLIFTKKRQIVRESR